MISVETIYLSDFLELADINLIKYLAVKFNIDLNYTSGGVKTRVDIELDILKVIAHKLEEMS